MRRSAAARRCVLLAAGWLAALAVADRPAPAGAQALADNGPPIAIARSAGEIEVDGAFGDPGWADAEPIATWWETHPGDSIEPAAGAGSVAWMTYDDAFLYAFLRMDDPDPRAVVSRLGDHDELGGGISDYAGLLLDTRGDGKVAQLFLVNASGVQFDGITSDAAGEDSAPDFFWESATRRTTRGWQLELRIPFSSIRYGATDPDHWGLLLFRDRPRAFRYQYATSKLPRARNCFVCNVRPLTGLHGLPQASHWVAAPYVSSARVEQPSAGPGGPLDTHMTESSGGLDFKWLPNPDTVVDVTLQPDFSQIESDTALITANERFALFQPEKRPFFLESVDLFSTPLQAVYTRTVTDPRWGARVTGAGERAKYTLLVGEDDGGGSVVLPGARSSALAPQDFRSSVALGSVRRELGRSFVGLLYSGREIDGGGWNRVAGPDFEWRPSEQDRIAGQLLWSASRTPDRPDLAAEWDGRTLSGHAAVVAWSRSDGRWDHALELRDLSAGFRADNGLIPQVGVRASSFGGGRTFRPDEGPVRRLRPFVSHGYKEDRSGALLERLLVSGFEMDALWKSSLRLELAQEDLHAVDHLFRRRQLRPSVLVRPGRVFASFQVDGALGDEVDFANDRLGEGLTLNLSAELTPGAHLRLAPLYRRRTLDVDAAPGLSGRLLTNEVARLKLVYTFNSRTWIRLVGQRTATRRRPELWTFPVAAREEDFAGSAVFAYKLNWQTVLFLGYADTRTLDDRDELRPAERQAFFKLSYAFRR